MENGEMLWREIFATQKGRGELKRDWKFPGGKIECFLCEVVSGNLELKEHEAAKWLQKEQFYEVDWLPADVSLIEKAGKMLQD